MKKTVIRAIITAAFLVCLFVLSVVGASAASGTQTITSGNLASAVESYRQSNPTASQHTIATGHKVVYAENAYFKDVVNGTASWFACYGKTGSDAVVTRLSAKGISAQAVSDASAVSAREILVGIVDRSAQGAFLPMIDVNEYAIVVTQNNVMLLAWQDVALKACVDAFLAYLNAGNLSLPVGFVGVGVANSTWAVDFVRPSGTGIALSAGQFVNDDSLQFLYTGDGVTNVAYRAYCAQLEADGFTLVWQNTVGNNEFRGYQNSVRGIVLYVAYNDYTYKAEFDALYQANYGTYDDTFDPQFEKCIRIVSSPRSSIALPSANISSQQSYVKVTDTYVTMLSIASAQVGTGYVIMLEDGRFVIIDGGGVSSRKNGVYPESKAIWDAMLALYKKAYGANATPTAQRPLHVAAWYLTHAHADHYNAFYYMVEMIGADASKKSVFKMDYVIANMIGEMTLFENTSTKWGYNNSEVIHNMKSKVGGFTYLKVHTGQRLYFANLMIEVLMTFEDHLPATIYNTNDTNTITRFHLKSSTTAAGGTVTALADNAVTMMFLGDSWRPASRYLCAMYGNYLRSDLSQIAHHGNIGCEKELYERIAPTGVFFNHDLSMFKSYVWGSTTSTNPESQHAYAVDQYVVKSLDSVRYVWAAVANVYPTLHLTFAGMEYDSAFSLSTGQVLSYSDVNSSTSSQNGFLKFVRTHTHTYGAWEPYTATQHKRVCACGAVEYADHDLSEGEITTPATHTEFGVKTYTCIICGGVSEEEIPKLTEHEYGAWQPHSETQHKLVCACSAEEYADHRWNNGKITTPSTHDAPGVKTYACIDCRTTREEEIPVPIPHEELAWEQYDSVKHAKVCACGVTEYQEHHWDEGEITTQSTHLVLGRKTYTCTDCGETKQTSIPKLTEHEYGECTSHNDMQHKHVCICGMVEYVLHTWGDPVVATQPTQTQEGIQTRNCAACGAVKEERIPVLPEPQSETTEQLPAQESEDSIVGSIVLVVAVAVLVFGGGVCLWISVQEKKRV